MTVSAQETVFQHVGNGVSVTFAYGCQVQRAADLSVYVADVLTFAGFTINGIGSQSGGSVTFSAAPASGVQIRLERIIVLERDTDYQQNGDFLSRVVNPDFDRLWMAAQQHKSGIDRSIKIPASDAPGFNTTLPASSIRANSLLGFNDLGEMVAVLPAPQSASALQLLLAGTTGTSIIGFLQAGAGAILRTLQAKLRAMLIDRDDFGTVGEFNAAAAASPTTPTLNDDGDFDAKVRPHNEAAQIALSYAARPVATSCRSIVRYYSASAVQVHMPALVVMAGFRFQGQYSRGRAPAVAAPASPAVVTLVSSNPVESAMHAHNWYGVFACSNAGDATATLKVMPFLRVGSVAGSVATLNYAGEGYDPTTPVAAVYTFTNNSMVGVDCLVINETVAGRANAFSGRVTTITANTTTTVTLGSIGAVAAFDFLLPAPPGFTEYCYLGSFYSDAGGTDVRNIADSGGVIKAKMRTTADPNYAAAGTIASPGVAIRFGGYISPLATAVILKDTYSLATASTGSSGTNFMSDGSLHEMQTTYYQKVGTGTETASYAHIELPFAFGQNVYYFTTGSLSAVRSGGTLDIKGWIEP